MTLQSVTQFSPSSRTVTRLPVVHQVAGVFTLTALTAIAAQIHLPVPGTPVPMTLQTAVVPLAAIILGGGLGAVSMALYLTVALLGAPVMAHGHAGPQFVFGATGGYLFGYILAQPLIARVLGTNANARKISIHRLIAAIAVGYVTIFTLGVLWLMLRMNLSFSNAIAQGLTPFLVGDLIKAAIVLMIAQAALPWAVRSGLR